MKTMFRVLLLITLSLGLTACGDEPAPVGDPNGRSASVQIPADLFTAEAPEGAVRVREVLAGGSNAQEVTIRGVVGGRRKVFVDSRAIFILVDEELEYCAQDHGCPTPWDYCCEDPDHLHSHSISVQVADDQGVPLGLSLRDVNGLKELSTVVVKGKLRSVGGAIVLDAESIFVEGA
ncbi:MAG: hypothetical protein AAF196_00355 [Planctomycetota bacterium]